MRVCFFFARIDGQRVGSGASNLRGLKQVGRRGFEMWNLLHVQLCYRVSYVICHKEKQRPVTA